MGYYSSYRLFTFNHRVRKWALFISITIVIGNPVLSQSKFAGLLDSVLLRAKETSLYTHQVDWQKLSDEVHTLAPEATELIMLKSAFERLINGLGDKHGKILNPNDYSVYAHFTDFEKLKHPDNRERDPDIWRIVNDTTQRFSYQKIDRQIGYLKIVGIAPNVDIQSESQKIRNALVELDDEGVNKWIIDLRYNGGGNMHPMVNGVGPLIGDGLVGMLTDLDGNSFFEWKIKESNFIYGGQQPVHLEAMPNWEGIPKVAILLSRWTVSSGELLATCFKGRPNTKFFGERSGGYTTNNNWEVIGDRVILSISSGVFADRTGEIYFHSIPVDEHVEFEVSNSLEKDPGIEMARNWLDE